MYRNTIKPSTFSIDLLLVFVKHIIGNTNCLKVFLKKHDFLKNLKSHENALKRR